MLKPLSEILEPDVRFANMVTGAPFNVRPFTLADHHGDIASITLVAKVPKRIVGTFERARNTYVYAWFVYEFTTLAENQAYAALEMALREYLGPKTGGKRWSGLGELFTAARGQGAFDSLPMWGDLEESDREPFLDFLLNVVREFRNELAHGSEYVNVPHAALDAIGRCAALINHLYR